MINAMFWLGIVVFVLGSSFLISLITAINSSRDSAKLHKELSAVKERVRILETGADVRNISESAVRAR